MFLQADFNRRVRGTRIVAFVWHVRAKWKVARVAELVVFVESRERAWWGNGGVSWGEAIIFKNLVHAPLSAYAFSSAEQCELARRN